MAGLSPLKLNDTRALLLLFLSQACEYFIIIVVMQLIKLGTILNDLRTLMCKSKIC